jgi:recombinational DNA repair protein (RecF pathway)
LLDGESEDAAPYLTIQFLWRAAGVMGFRPPLDSCIGCGSEILTNGIHSYSRLEGGFLCADCRAKPGDGRQAWVVELDPGAARYLERTVDLDIRAALRVRLESRSLSALKAIVYDVAERIVDGPLKTIETGRGIL